MLKILDRRKGNRLIKAFKKTRILVIGDIILDHFIWGNVQRISPEAPVPVVEVTSENMMLGGAVNVVNNIHSLGGEVYIGGIVGRDEDGKKVIEELKERGISTNGIVLEDGRPTSIKTRIIAHNQQVVRFDKEKKGEISAKALKAILDYAKGMADEVNVLIISDYAKGVISRELVKELIALYRENGRVVVIDPKVKHINFYKGATVITPNTFEASKASGIDIEDDDSLERSGRHLLETLSSEAVLITRGEHGMALFEKTGDVTFIPTVAHDVYDVTGAGDTVIGVFALALASGTGYKEAAVLANYAAGVVVGEVGTAVVRPEELFDAIIKGK
ncbi:MAG: D-glycero-beta-D-manno-heptose-7-phosphate kinase [Thermodesulfobacteriota bacterium]